MTSKSIGPISLSERLEIIDVLRGLAVCGILIGNMQWFSGYGMVPPAMHDAAPMIEKVVQFLVHFLVEGKFYSIFSFLFGFGFALQIARADERGDVKASLFKRRLLWLLVIGVLHAYLLWAGDILSVYAVMGFVLLLFRNKSDRSLLKWAFWLMVVPVVTYTLIYILFRVFVPPDALAGFDAAMMDRWNDTVTMARYGTWWEIVSKFNLQYIVGRYAGLIIQMRLPKILAMFLLGMCAHRIGVFQNLAANRPLLKRVALWSGVLGVLGNIAFAWLAGNEGPFPPDLAGVFGVAAYAFGVPALALFIIAIVALAWQSHAAQKTLSILAPVGRMALTNYILQTVVCVTIFYGYGFQRFGTIGATAATLIALAIFAVQIVLSTLWLHFFQYGPLEWVWRQLTYGKRLALRRA